MNKYLDLKPPQGLPLFAVPQFDPTLAMPANGAPRFQYSEPMNMAEPQT